MELLAVPQYVDVMDEDGDASKDEAASTTPQSGLVKFCAAWQNEMAKWVQEEQDQSEDEDDNLADVMHGCQCSKWLLQLLDLLFGGWKETDIDKQVRWIQRQQAYMEEAHLMELLADEEVNQDRIPDDGELEGSGDNFNG